MGEAVFFRNLTTKGLTAVNSGERYFEGYLTVQVKDKQGEVTIVDELMKVLPVWIDRGAPISDTHSNRIIGKGINYSKTIYKDSDGTEYPAIMVTGKIHKNYELDNDIWTKIKSGEYKGLSFGGATKADREPMRMKDGSIAYSLKDLEHYEVAVCRDPAVPLALITEYNTLAKAAVDGQDLGGGRMLIKCDKYGCYVDKANNSEAGLKAPEARNEALVYDDKTYDQPNETPLENQAKIKKGEDESKLLSWDESDEDARKFWFNPDKTRKQIDEEPESDNYGLPTDHNRETCPHCNRRGNPKKLKKGKDDAKDAQHMDESEAVFRHATGQDKGVRDSSVAGKEDIPKQGQQRHDLAEENKAEYSVEEVIKVKVRHRDGSVTEEEGTKEEVSAKLAEHNKIPYGFRGSFSTQKPCTWCQNEARENASIYPKPGEDPEHDKHQKEHIDPKTGYTREDIKSRIKLTDYGKEVEESEKKRQSKKGEDKEKAKKRETARSGQYADTIDTNVEWARRMVGRKQESKKGQDWSNADGDRHSMFNQDTDEGGMGKKHTGPKGCKCGDPKCKDPKCKKREVRTGHGAEKNDAGEVHWSGSGSPYPKLVKARLKLMDIEKKQTKRRRKLREEREAKEQAEFDKVQEKTRKRLAGETGYVPDPNFQEDKRVSASTSRSQHNIPTEYPLGHAFDQEKEYKKLMDEEKEREEGFGKKKKKKKDVDKTMQHMTPESPPPKKPKKTVTAFGNPPKKDRDEKGAKKPRGYEPGTEEGAVERNKAFYKLWLEKDAPKDIAQQTQSGNVPKKDSWIAGMGDKDIGLVSRIREPRGQSHGSQSTAARKRGERANQKESKQQTTDDPRRRGSYRDTTTHRREKAAIITNIHSRLKSLDFLLMAKKRKLSEYYDTGVGEADHPVKQQEVSAEQETHNTPTDLGHKFESASGLLGEKDSFKPLKQRKEDKRGKKKSDEKQGTSRVHQAEQKELDQAMGTIPGQTDTQTTRKRLGIGHGAARFSKKDGEFGGMNTGETEWTEPRDTANSRTKRDKDVA